MSLFSEAAGYLAWEDSKASLRLPLPVLEVVFSDDLAGPEQALIEKILGSLPFEVSGFERVQKPKSSFCIDFTRENSQVMASASVGDLMKDPESKKLLWAQLLKGGPRRKAG